MASESELDDLANDIRAKGGLIYPVVFCGDELLDGRNRIEAGERSGLLDVELLKDKDSRLRIQLGVGIDPYEYVLSANLHRRHLTEERRRQLIGDIIKAKPEESDRAIAKKVKRDHKVVARVRKKLESTGAVAPVQKRVGADGKRRKKPEQYERDRPECTALAEKAKAADPEFAEWLQGPKQHRATGSAERDIEKLRAEYAALGAAEPCSLTVEDDLEPHEYRPKFLARCLDCLTCAVYSGEVDSEVIAAAERVVAKWQNFTQTLKAKFEQTEPNKQEGQPN
jgi:hypothetical protein